MSERDLRTRWVRATWAGWLFGVPIVVVLALAGEVVGIGGALAFFAALAGYSVWSARALRHA